MSEQLDANQDQVITPSLTSTPVEPIIDDPIADPSPAPVENEAIPAQDSNSGAQKRINQLTAKRYEETRRADAADGRVAELERQLEQSKSQAPANIQPSPEAPQLPSDVYDQEAMTKYHTDMLAHGARVAEKAAIETFEGQQRKVEQGQQKERAQQTLSTYASNAVRDGVDMDKLRAAEGFLNSSGITDSLADYIMSDNNGGKIAEYLGDNPAEAIELFALDPISAGIKIANEIKPRALSTTPRVSNAPPPIENIVGGGVPDKDDFARQYPGTTFN